MRQSNSSIDSRGQAMVLPQRQGPQRFGRIALTEEDGNGRRCEKGQNDAEGVEHPRRGLTAVDVQQKEADRHLSRGAAHEIPGDGEKIVFGRLLDLIQGQVELVSSEAVRDGHRVDNNSYEAEHLWDYSVSLCCGLETSRGKFVRWTGLSSNHPSPDT